MSDLWQEGRDYYDSLNEIEKTIRSLKERGPGGLTREELYVGRGVFLSCRDSLDGFVNNFIIGRYRPKSPVVNENQVEDLTFECAKIELLRLALKKTGGHRADTARELGCSERTVKGMIANLKDEGIEL